MTTPNTPAKNSLGVQRAHREARAELSNILGSSAASLICDASVPLWYEKMTGHSWDNLIEFHTPTPRTEVTAADLRRSLFDVLGRTVNYGSAVVEAYKVTDTSLVVSLTVFDIREMKRREVIQGAGKRLLRYSLDDAGVWRQVDSITVWFDDFEPVATVDQYYTVNSPARYESSAWQYFNCYRPGTDKFPMDGPLAPSRDTEIDPIFVEISA